MFLSLTRKETVYNLFKTRLTVPISRKETLDNLFRTSLTLQQLKENHSLLAPT